MTSQAPLRQLQPHIQDFFKSEGLAHVSLLELTPVHHHPENWRRHTRALKQWLQKKKHAQMHFMERNTELRENPQRLMENASSAFLFLIPYATGKRVRRQATTPEEPQGFIQKIARYARHKDYHKVIKKRLNQTMTTLAETVDSSLEFRVVVDSAPFLERAHAQMAGLGFVGKNTMLIRPGLGSYFFIATVLTNAPSDLFSLESTKRSTAIENLDCGSCNLCVEACPTDALTEARSLDANRCFSFWSIESRQTAPDGIVPTFKDLFFGCDICQSVCPYNHVTSDDRGFPEFQSTSSSLNRLTLLQIACLSQQEYESLFGGLPLTRAKRAGLIRNALYGLFANEDWGALERARAHWKGQENCPELVQSTLDQLHRLQSKL